QYYYDSNNACSGAMGGIGCILGLPWVGLKVDCLGTTYTWPFDHVPCQTSLNNYGPRKVPCTMSDRLSMFFYYLHQLFLVMFEFVVHRIELIVDIGFAIVSGPGLETSICAAIVEFFLEIRDPLFGMSNKILSDDFNTLYTSPWPNTTGINQTKLDN